MSKLVEEFNAYRSKMNEKLLGEKLKNNQANIQP